MEYVVYIVRCVDDTLYTGIAKDVAKRIYTHNHSVVGAKYTKSRRPVELVYQEQVPDKSTALKREYEIKSLPREQKHKLIASQTS